MSGRVWVDVHNNLPTVIRVLSSDEINSSLHKFDLLNCLMYWFCDSIIRIELLLVKSKTRKRNGTVFSFPILNFALSLSITLLLKKLVSAHIISSTRLVMYQVILDPLMK